MEGRNIHRGELNDDNGIFLLLSLPRVLSGIRLPKLLIRIIDQFHLSLRLMNSPDRGARLLCTTFCLTKQFTFCISESGSQWILIMCEHWSHNSHCSPYIVQPGSYKSESGDMNMHWQSLQQLHIVSLIQAVWQQLKTNTK